LEYILLSIALRVGFAADYIGGTKEVELLNWFGHVERSIEKLPAKPRAKFGQTARLRTAVEGGKNIEHIFEHPVMSVSIPSLQDKVRFADIFREICQITFLDDGVQFDVEKVSVAEIMEQRRYAGLQIRIPVSLGSMKQLMKIDVGFGDIVTPPPSKMTYPTLLDMVAPEIKAYSPETVIAEKFEAMIDLAESNSRIYA
jgi:hypothetical protein